ncbi:MAG: hypothetical protein Q8R60_14090 [Mycobacteriales bacterium]|nr:hypothetical protein [Mycobacteriales bacterium]
MRLPRLVTAATAAAVALVALTACGGDPATTAGGASPSSATTTASSAATPDASTTSAGPGTSQAPTTGGGPAAAGTNAPTSGATGAAPRRTTAAVAPSSAGKTAERQATAPGDYLYDSSGTFSLGGAPQPVDGTSTLTVDPVVDGTQHSVLEGEDSRTEQDVLVRENGTYVARLQITNAGFDKAFEFDPAEVLVPTPATVGTTWSWVATSTDGKTRATQNSKVVRSETLTIGGKQVATQVIQTTLRLSGDISYTGEITTHYAESLHLPVKERTKGNGTVQGFSFSMDVTATARSTTPA